MLVSLVVMGRQNHRGVAIKFSSHEKLDVPERICNPEVNLLKSVLCGLRICQEGLRVNCFKGREIQCPGSPWYSQIRFGITVGEIFAVFRPLSEPGFVFPSKSGRYFQ